MERRDFLKMASMAGLGVVVAGPLAGRASAAPEPYTGTLWLTIHAGGGWDPTSFCDPKGTDDLADPNRMNNYLASTIEQAGPISYAPVGTNQAFFQKWHSRILVVNGIDTGTNSHDAGTRTTWSGTLIDGKPSFAALVAGAYGAGLPMGYISNGGYDQTAGVVAVTRVPDTGVLQRIAFPNVINPGDQNEERYHTEATIQRVLAARDERHLAKMDRNRLPRIRETMNTLYTSRLGQNELKQLIQYLPDQFEQDSLKRQAQVAIAAYRAGICISANLSIGGFDTHGNHDQQHIPRLGTIWDGVDFIMEYAVAQGIADKMVIAMGSDFGRTPGYNDGDGKDHWNITSMMFMGAGITGDRVIGATDERHGPLTVDPTTAAASPSGIRIKPGHIHKGLRKLAGIEGSEVAQKFPIAEEEDLPIFV